jgi:hypothetical protein
MGGASSSASASSLSSPKSPFSLSKSPKSSHSQQSTPSSQSGTCRPGGNCRKCRKHLQMLINSSTASTTTPDILRRFLTIGPPRIGSSSSSGSNSEGSSASTTPTPTSNNQKDQSPISANSGSTGTTVVGVTPRSSLRDKPSVGAAVVHGSFPASPRRSSAPLACLNDLNYTLSDGSTPLEAAINSRSLSLACISVLLEFGAHAAPRLILRVGESYLYYSSLMTSMVAYGQLTMERAINEWGYPWLAHITNLDWLTLLRFGLDPFFYNPMKSSSQPPLWLVSSSNINRAPMNIQWQKELIDTIIDCVNGLLTDDIIDTIVVRYFLCPLSPSDI